MPAVSNERGSSLTKAAVLFHVVEESLVLRLTIKRRPGRGRMDCMSWLLANSVRSSKRDTHCTHGVHNTSAPRNDRQYRKRIKRRGGENPPEKNTALTQVSESRLAQYPNDVASAGGSLRQLALVQGDNNEEMFDNTVRHVTTFCGSKTERWL